MNGTRKHTRVSKLIEDMFIWTLQSNPKNIPSNCHVYISVLKGAIDKRR